MNVTTSLDTTNQVICGVVTSLSPFAVLTTNALPGRLYGEGYVDAGGLRYHFEFRAEKQAGGKVIGSLDYRQMAIVGGSGDPNSAEGPELNHFTADSATFAGFFSAATTPGHQSTVDSVTLAGRDSGMRVPGYTFEVTATDLGNPSGQGGIIAITIRGSKGNTVAGVKGTLGGGTIQALP